MSLWLDFRWWFRYRRYLTKDRLWFDGENGRKIYRGLPYCLDCRCKMLEFGKRCKDCQDDNLVF